MKTLNSKGITLIDGLIYFAVAGILIAGVAPRVVPPTLSKERQYTATVTEKAVKGQEGKYLIFAKLPDNSMKVFENTDSIIKWKFNSSDVYANIVPGKTYDFNTYGWRVPPLSLYENILTAKEVPAKSIDAVVTPTK